MGGASGGGGAPAVGGAPGMGGASATGGASGVGVAAMGGASGAGGAGGGPLCSGFSKSETAWSLPAPRAGDSWFEYTDLNCNTTNDTTYVLNDLNGDGRPDLIVTALCGGGGPAGLSGEFWNVYFGQCNAPN